MHKRILLTTAVIPVLAAGGLFYANSRGPEDGRERMAVRPPGMPGKVARVTNAAVIEGRAINAEGRPIAGAEVCANRDDTLRQRLQRTRSDERGNFRLEVEVPEPGIYTVCGSKEEDGYPSNISGFHYEEGVTVPQVYLENNQTVRDIILNLGSKAASVEGIITDATDQQPVSRVTITLRRADNPDMLYMIGAAEPKDKGKFKVLVPSAPFTIEVSSEEYETWTYSNDGLNNRPEPLIAKRGQTKLLNIALRPKSSFGSRGK